MKRTESTSSPQVLKNKQPEEFDLVILGGGTGSTIAAWTFAGEGKQVAVVERKYIGGSRREEPRSPPHEVICNSNEKNRNSRSGRCATYFATYEALLVPKAGISEAIV